MFHHDLLHRHSRCMLLRQGASLVLHHDRSDGKIACRLSDAVIPVCPSVLAVKRFRVLTLHAACSLYRTPRGILVRPRAFREGLLLANDAPALMHVSSFQLTRRILQRLHLAHVGGRVLEGQAAGAAMLGANLWNDIRQLQLIGPRDEWPLLWLLLTDVPVCPSISSRPHVSQLAVALSATGPFGRAPGASLTGRDVRAGGVDDAVAAEDRRRVLEGEEALAPAHRLHGLGLEPTGRISDALVPLHGFPRRGLTRVAAAGLFDGTPPEVLHAALGLAIAGAGGESDGVAEAGGGDGVRHLALAAVERVDRLGGIRHDPLLVRLNLLHAVIPMVPPVAPRGQLGPRVVACDAAVGRLNGVDGAPGLVGAADVCTPQERHLLPGEARRLEHPRLLAHAALASHQLRLERSEESRRLSDALVPPRPPKASGALVRLRQRALLAAAHLVHGAPGRVHAESLAGVELLDLVVRLCVSDLERKQAGAAALRPDVGQRVR
mmetsp:Transcript_23323/g.52384  ORF Transcript_23323/g.52384 Transcript_23323/m.52384 type:complete len:493 (-) Transcript_23323:1843-3321(-)